MRTLRPSFSALIRGRKLCILAFLHPSQGGPWGLPGLFLAPHDLILGLFLFILTLPSSSWPVLRLAESSSVKTQPWP